MAMTPPPDAATDPAVPPREPRGAGDLRIQGPRAEFVTAGQDRVTIGRDLGNSLVLDDARVSRFHAELHRAGEAWWLEDSGSKNGTFVDGRPIRRLRIAGPTRVLLADPITGVGLELVPLPATGASPDWNDELGPAAGTHPLTRRLRIGRAADNDVVLNITVSRHHAELVTGPDGTHELVDLSSHNGTYLNGRWVERARVRDDDLIGIGGSVLLLRDGRLEERSQADVSLQVLGLSVIAGEAVLLDDVSFGVSKGSFLATVGPSGAGKSTRMGALTGFRPAQKGRVLYGGRDLYANYEELRRRIGYVPQDDILHPQLTVRAALCYAAELRFPPDVARSERERRVDEVMAELHLTERAGLRIEKLSAGQRKRVSIALELLTRPSLLFLDEATSGLDPGFEKDLMKIIRELADGGRTVVLVTHSVQSLDLCDRLLFLAPGGRMAYFGPPDRALGFFGAGELADVFQSLEARRDVDFKAWFEASPEFETYVRRPLAAHAAGHPRPPNPDSGVSSLRGGWWRQLWTLSRRYLSVIASDRVNTALLLLQAPILAGIIAVAVGTGAFDVRQPDALGPASQAILFLIVSATYLGAGNSIREIVKERSIYARERATGISISAYLGSKVAVLALVTALQAAVLVWLGTVCQDASAGGAWLPDLRWELWVVLFGAGLAAMGLGLLISTLVSRPDKALTLLPLVLVSELVLTFPQLHIDEKPMLNQASYLASAQWAYAAAASSDHLNLIIYNRAVSTDPRVARNGHPDQASPSLVQQVRDATDLELEQRWRHDGGSWAADIWWLLALLVVELALAGYALRRREGRPRRWAAARTLAGPRRSLRPARRR